MASMRAKVEHPFVIVKGDFGLAKNFHHLQMLFALGGLADAGPCPSPSPHGGQAVAR